MKIFLALSLINLAFSSTYTLVASDITLSDPTTNTWVDVNNSPLGAITTLQCSLLPQPSIMVTGSSAQTLSNTYTLTASASTSYEAYIKVIFSGTWETETFTIYSGSTSNVLKTETLTSSAFTTTFCSLTNVKVILFKVQISLAAQTTSLKLILGYPAGTSTKTIYIGPILIYRADPDAAISTAYISSDQFYYFKDMSQNPSAYMSLFSLTSGNGLKFDLMTVGPNTVNFMIGGYEIFGQGTITYTKPLNAHYSVKLSFYLYLYDSTTALTSSNLIITLNGPSGTVTLGSTSMKLLQAGNLYGGSAREYIYFISTEQVHTADNLIVTVENTQTLYVGITKMAVLVNYCLERCKVCKSQGTCDLCNSTENRDLVNCLCLQKFYEDPQTQKCLPCDYRCNNCVYNADTTTYPSGKCSNCKFGFDIDKECTKCFYSYQFENVAAVTCDNCASCCETCTGPTDRECLTFRTGYYIMPDNQGVSNCPSNYFVFNQAPKRSFCILCDGTCKTCIEQSAKCTSCFDGYSLLFDQCLLDCPPSQYRAGVVCLPCVDTKCQTCTATQCLLCKENNFLRRKSQICEATCEPGYYGEIKTLTCVKCHQTCFECVGPSFTECTSCVDTQFMLTMNEVKGTGMCYKTCKEGYFPENKKCARCFEGCQFCTAFKVCQTCAAGYYLEGNTCVSSCSPGLYPNDTVQKCYKCNTACQTCFGPESYQCYLCTGGLSQYQGKCYENCPITTVSAEGVCQSCTSSCNVCVGTAINDCTTCQSQKYILDGQCYDECPANYEANIVKRTCEYCVTKNCQTCVASYCKLCQNTFYQYQLLCSKDCPYNTYKSEVDRECKPCDNTCLTCSGPNTDNCLTCPTTYYFYLNNCLPACPEGYFSDASKICQQCDSTCQTCNGTASNQCISCVDSYLLNGECLVTCPDKYYPSDFYQTCQPCHTSCLTCQGPTQNECLTCPVYIERMKCVTACSNNFLLDSNGIECGAQFVIDLTCKPQCLKCSLIDTNCNTCVASRLQNKPQCSCLKGTYDIDKPDCAPCLNKCATCSGSADACIACKGNRFGATCLCPDYYYDDLISANCPRCGYKCALCEKATDSTSSVCTTCGDIRINPPTCGCPDGYFDNVQTACVKCDLSCATCVNQDSNCLTCSGIRENPPFCTCPIKFFDFQSKCIDCPFECDYCDQGGCVICNGNQNGPYQGKCVCKNGYERKSIKSYYCTNCDMGVPNAIMLSGLEKIKVDFGGPIVYIDSTKTGCDQFFSATVIASFGTGATCDLSEFITITLGKQATINIGDEIVFGTGFMLKGCTATFNQLQPAFLLLDPQLTDEDNLPYIQFGGLSPKSICETVPIKFKVGNAGSRDLKQFDWVLTLPQNYENKVLTQLLGSMDPTNTFDTLLTIPKQVLSPFTFYQITISYNNFLDLDTQSQLYVQSLGSASIDLLKPETSNTYYRYEKAVLSTTFTYYNCTLVGSMFDTLDISIKYGNIVLAEYSEVIELTLSTVYTITQVVQPYVFSVGSNNVTISASIPAQSLSYSIVLNQEISMGSLSVKILGGNRQVGDVAIVRLTATVVDLDVGPEETDSFNYVFTWNCLDVLLGADCRDPYDKLLKYQPGRTITVSAGELSQYNSYIFTASTEKETKKAHAKSMIQIVEVDLPQLQPANQTQEDLTLAQIYNYYDDVSLSFVYEAANPDNLLYTATVIYNLESKKSFEFYSLSFKFRLLDHFTDLTEEYGNVVQLRVSVYNPKYVMPSLRTLDFLYNLPPTSCEVILNNNSPIYEFSTTVNFTITNCQDDNVPFQYKVLFYNNQTIYEQDKSSGRFQNNFILIDYQANNSLLFTVPFVGNPKQDNHTSLLVFFIKDNANGITNITYPLIIHQDKTINQTMLSKMIDHEGDLPSAIKTQDYIVTRLDQQKNCSELKYEILRRNDFLIGNNLPVDQQNSLLNQMTILTANEEVNHQFKLDLGFLYSFNQSQEINYQELKALVESGSDTLKKQQYIQNYFKYFDLFSNLIENGIYFSSTNTDTLTNIDVVKDHLIDFTIVNDDGYSLKNSNSKLTIRKTSESMLNSLTGNILQEELLFRLLTTTQSTNYEYYYQVYETNPYLYEETFPTNYSIDAAVIYLKVINEATQEDAVMLQPFQYTFIVDEIYGTNKTVCIQRQNANWTKTDIETSLVNSTAITCKISVFNPFTIIYNTTSTTNTTTNSTTNSTNTNTTNTNNTSNTTSQTNVDNGKTDVSNSDSAFQPLYIYFIVIGILFFILFFFAHFKDQQFAKVAQQKGTHVDIMITENKRDDTPAEKKQDFDYLKQATNTPSLVFRNTQTMHSSKLKLILLNFHQFISIFYRTQGYRKYAYLVYLLRVVLIQITIFITYIYKTFHYEVVLIYIFSHFVFSIFSYFLNYPFQKQKFTIIKLVLTILCLTLIGLGIYRMVTYIQENENLDEIMYILVSQVLFDILVYNPIVVFILYLLWMKENKFGDKLLEWLPTEDRELIYDQIQNL